MMRVEELTNRVIKFKIVTMKKLAISLIFIISLFLLPSISLAQTSTPTQTPQEKRLENQGRLKAQKDALQNKREDLKFRLEEKKATREAKLSEVRRNRIRTHWEKLNRRLLAVMDRLEKLIERIESRLAKLETTNPNADTNKIKADLEEAKQKLSDLKEKLDLSNASFEEVITSDDLKGAFEEVRETIQEIKLGLIEVHRILVHVIGDIKGLRVGQLTVTPRLTLTPEP